MAESADILTGPHQQVILPDLNAGCSMADMADIDSVEEAWDVPGRGHRHRSGGPGHLHELGRLVEGLRRCATVAWCAHRRTPGPYSAGPSGPMTTGTDEGTRSCSSPISTSAATPASSSATAPTTWPCGTRVSTGAASTTPPSSRPPCSCGRGTARSTSGSRPAHVDAFRAEHPDGIVVVHPECSHEVVAAADLIGSTDFIIRAVAEAPSGSVIGVGTEIHLVKRLDDETPDKSVVSLDPLVCPCSTMFRVDAAHLAWVLEGLVAGEVRNRITVDEETASWARVALERMLATV